MDSHSSLFRWMVHVEPALIPATRTVQRLTAEAAITSASVRRLAAALEVLQ